MMFTVTVSQDRSNVPHGHAERTEAETWALARFVKRVGWTEFRGNAADEAEACEIRNAIDKLPNYNRRLPVQASRPASVMDRL